VRVEHLFLSNPVYPPSCLLTRRDAFVSVGGFDARFLAEDWEFVTRLARRGPFVPIDRVMVGYRRHGSNASRDRQRNVRGARQVWAAVYYAAGGSVDLPDRLRARWRAHQLRVSKRKLVEGRMLVARGRVLGGISRLVDGAAHALLRHPLRGWMPTEAPLRPHLVRPLATSEIP
jgi:GT2 family glycosyltransferase